MDESEIEVLRQDLRALAKQIEKSLAALAEDTGQGDRPDRDWEDMLRAHAKIQEALRGSGSMTRLVIEGLRLDIDILNHSFRRWISRNDQKFRESIRRQPRRSDHDAAQRK